MKCQKLSKLPCDEYILIGWDNKRKIPILKTRWQLAVDRLLDNPDYKKVKNKLLQLALNPNKPKGKKN